ncbi:MAG: hypothetical protein V4475_19720 [Pseudomonadota bacterium]
MAATNKDYGTKRDAGLSPGVPPLIGSDQAQQGIPQQTPSAQQALATAPDMTAGAAA